MDYAYRVEWSPEDNEFVGLVAEFPSLSWLAPTSVEAMQGIVGVVEQYVLSAHKQDCGTHVATEDLQRLGQACVGLADDELMGKAWDDQPG